MILSTALSPLAAFDLFTVTLVLPENPLQMHTIF